jgi:hypothetical protein
MTLRDGFGWRSSMTALFVLVGAVAAAPVAGCQADDTAAGDTPEADAGSHADGSKAIGSGGAGKDAASPSDTKGAEAGSGSGAALADAGETVNAADAKAGTATPDADAGPTCLAHGAACGDNAGAEPCCTDTCVNGVCGCLPEGAKVTSGGAGACCNGLAQVDGGYCGTSSCVPDGTPCGGDAGPTVCCNDNCNGTTCGGQ